MAFEEWLEAMHPRTARFEDFLMPPDWRGDYSRRSLIELERHVLDRWSDVASFEGELDRDFIDGATRYIGETLIEACGGYWFVSHDPDFMFVGAPCVRLDNGGTVPISPYNLLFVILDRKSGVVLSKIYDAQTRRVEERKRNEPAGWVPERKSTPGMEILDRVSAPELREWSEKIGSRLLLVKERVFQEEELEFGDSSVLLVETAVLDDSISGRMGKSPHDSLRASYATYLGEAALRRAGGGWVYIPGELNEKNSRIGSPFVERKDDRGEWRSCIPFLSIKFLEESGQVGHFLRVLNRYSG